MSVDEVIIGHLQTACSKKSLAFFSTNNLRMVFQTQILYIEAESVTILNTIPIEYISDVVGANEYVLQSQKVRLTANEIGTDGKNIIFPLREIDNRKEIRQSERFTFGSDEGVVVELLNPFDGETVCSKSILEMSSSGMSLRARHDSKLFEPGVEFANIKILVDGKPYNQVQGKVVYKHLFFDQQHKRFFQIGFSFNV